MPDRTLLRLAPLLLLLLASCDDAGIGGTAGPDGEQTDGTRYAREMVFVAADATGAALLDFETVDEGSVLRRSARGWAEGGSGWTPLYDLSWEGTPVRRAWRLVPHGPLRVRVALGDEIEGISVREEENDLLTLETGDFVGEWDPSVTTQVVVRAASLALGGEPMDGWLVDARFGVARSVEAEEGGAPNGVDEPDVVAPATELPQDADTQSAGPATREESVAAIETATTLRIHSLRGVLVGPEGETLVLARTDGGLAGWFRSEADERTMPILTLAPFSEGRGGWSIEAGGGSTLSGTLQALDEEPAPLAPRMVGGTIRIGATELELHGVLRPDDTAQ